MPKSLRERDRLRLIETALVGLEPPDVVKLLMRSSYRWLVDKVATQSDTNARQQLQAYCNREKIAGPSYRYRDVGSGHKRSSLSIVSIKTQPGLRESAECDGQTRTLAAEAAAANLLVTLNVK